MTEHANSRRRRGVALRLATLQGKAKEGVWRAAEVERLSERREVNSTRDDLDGLVQTRAATAASGQPLCLDRWAWSLIAEDAVATELQVKTKQLAQTEIRTEAARMALASANRRTDKAKTLHDEAKHLEAHQVELGRLDATLDLLAARGRA